MCAKTLDEEAFDAQLCEIFDRVRQEEAAAERSRQEEAAKKRRRKRNEYSKNKKWKHAF